MFTAISFAMATSGKVVIIHSAVARWGWEYIQQTDDSPVYKTI